MNIEQNDVSDKDIFDSSYENKCFQTEPPTERKSAFEVPLAKALIYLRLSQSWRDERRHRRGGVY